MTVTAARRGSLRCSAAESLERRAYLAGVLSISDASVVENDTGTPALLFTIDWVGTLGEADSCFFNIATSDGTASAAEGDYVAVSQRIDFLPFTSHRKTFRVTVNSDMRDESNETLNVTMSNAINAVIADGTGVGTIIEDDDHRPTVQVVPVSPPFRDTPVPSITIQFSEPVTGFDVGDLVLSRDGGPNLLTAAQGLATSDFQTWTLNGLAGLTAAHGDYQLSVSADPVAAAITDVESNPLAAGASTGWSNIIVVTPPPGPIVADGPEFRVNTYTPESQFFPSTATDAAGNFVVAWTSRSHQDNPPALSDGIYAQLYDAGGVPRGGEFLVNTTVVSNQTYAVAAMDDAGDFVIAWQGQDASDTGIFARRYSAAGVARGPEFPVNAYTLAFQANPAVAMDRDGDFVVTWQSQNQVTPQSFNDVYARRFNGAGVAAGPEFLVNASYTTSQQWNPTAAMDAAGDFVIAWESLQHDPDNSSGIFAQRYNASGAAVGGEFRVNTYTVSDQVEPAAAMDADGDFVVTWHGYEFNGNYGVFARRFDALGNAPIQFDVSTTLAGFQRYSAVAMDDDGDFVVTWQDEHSGANPGPTSIVARRFGADAAAVTGEFIVNSTNVGNHRYPAAAMDADGDFVIAWAGYGQDPGDTQFQAGVYAQRYAAVRAPRVKHVYARGTSWTLPFLAYLESQGLGSSRYGFEIGGGADELAPLPWIGVDQVSIAFDRDVAVEQRHLVVRGLTVATYANSAFAYAPATHTATWTLGQNVPADKLVLDLDGDARTSGVAGTTGLRLDGEWSTGGTFPSGDGNAGGDFQFRLDVLPGDADRSGSVLANDYSDVKKKFFSSTAAPGPAGATQYTVFHDVDGGGNILANDFSEVKKRFFNTLPGGSPAAATSAAPFAPRRARPVAAVLFSSASILE